MPTQTKKSSTTRKKSPPPKRPIRREVGALVCLLLAVLLFIGFGESGGPLISGLRTALLWLFGSGFYVVPFVLVFCAFTLGFHRGHPVVLRVTCSLLFPLVLAVIIQGCGGDGGRLSGGISDLISRGTHPAFTVVLFLVLAVVLLFFIFNRLIRGLAQAYFNRERREYEQQPEREITLPSLPALPGITEIKPRERRRRPKKGEFDIPLDEKPPKSGDAIAIPCADAAPDTPPRRIRPESDIPLDIPFMEEPRRTPESAPPSELISKRPPRRAAIDIPVEPFEIPQEESSEPATEPTPPTSEPEAVAEKPTTPAPRPAPVAAIVPSAPREGGAYVFPPLDLLAPPVRSGANEGGEEVRINVERLESAFRSFGVNVRIANATRGPSVTRYEAELEAGVKLSRLTNLADDIALSLGASGVRIGPMPGRISTVGIEVPNKTVSTVYLREIIESKDFTEAKEKLSFAIGRNISGDCIVGNISKLPHMLVAGTTGSGKSVCLNSMILSILYKATPDEVRFIMIDPKLVEFRIFNGIPHLLVPVVTDAKKASGALQWGVVEMEKRYRMFADRDMRDLEGFNKLMVKDGEKPLPKIVVVIDELADLMMTCGKEVEESIIRIAQKGRAAGIHLVLATQSPRADVITGLMKANIPSRIALKVSSSLESRIILDAGGGADKLVGNGDMLYAPIGTTKPVRIQGTWVSDEEREDVVKFIKMSGESQYSDEIMGEIEKAAESRDKANAKPEPAEESDYDEMLPAAAEVIFDVQQASTSMLQRRLKLGYARAARIVDQLEEIGVLGPFEGSKPRQILLTRDQWREMQLVQGTAPIEKIPPAGEFEPPDEDYNAPETDVDEASEDDAPF